VTTDRLQHRFWDEGILLNHYTKIDAWLGHMLASLDSNVVVFLVSDHGFGPVRYTLNINEFLISEGYLKLAEQKKIKRQSLLYSTVRKFRLLSLARNLVRLLPNGVSQKITSEVAPKKFDELDIDWKHTKAFAYGVFGDIYINVKGREPEGTVDPNEYDKIRDEIIQKLKNLSHKGKKLNIKVYKKEELYPGATIWDDLPDLVVLPTDDGVQAINPNVGMGEIITESPGTVGNHRLNGIFLAYGPGIKKGQKIEGAKIYDIAPTILHIFGLPIPNDMDGRVLMEIFEDDSEFAKRRPKYVDPSYYEKKQADEKLRKAIKNLKLKGKI